jgi:adenosine deaminase
MVLGIASVPSLPKIVLHDHIDGGVRPATVLDLGLVNGLDLPAYDVPGLETWFYDQANSGSLERYLATFEYTVGVMQTTSNLARVAREAVVDLAADQVVHAELRFAPEQHQREGLGIDQVVDAVLAGIEEGRQEVRDKGRRISVGLILSAMRGGSGTGRTQEIAATALAYRDKGVVAFDTAGPEKGFPSTAYQEAFTTLRDACMPVTVHAGEADGLDSIWAAVAKAGALRLGHGTRIIDDISGLEPLEVISVPWGQARHDGAGVDRAVFGTLAHWVRDQSIALEMCPTSNLQTGAAASYRAHPATVLKRMGFAVTLNTDNRLMSSTSMTKEATMMLTEVQWSMKDLYDVTLNAARAAFLHADERAELIERVIRPAWDQTIRW